MLSHEYRAIEKVETSHHLQQVILLNVEIDEENELVMIDEFFDVSQTDFRPVWLKDTCLTCFLRWRISAFVMSFLL